MKINLDYIDGDSDDLMQIEWPEAWRLPAVGETILIGIGTFVVRQVQWELDQADYEPSVLLQVGDLK